MRASTAIVSLLCILPMSSASAVSLQTRTVQPSATVGSVYAVHDYTGSRVIEEGGELTNLPEGLQVYDLEVVEQGWVASGMVGTEEGSEIVVLRQGEPEAEVLPLPPGRTGAYRRHPVILIQGGALAGVAWVEGDRQEEFAIMAAPWTGKGWAEPEVVSAGGGGAQLALAGAVLNDSTWLLIWAAVDGEDDEIVWSRRADDGAWSVPARIHEDNGVPDILPALTPTASGAVAVWSWFDGSDYRLRSARFEADGWHVGDSFGGKAALRAGFVGRESGSFLLYKTVDPETWVVLEHDAQGAPGRQAEAPREPQGRPVVFPRPDSGVRLLWSAGPRGPETDVLRDLEWEPKP